MPSLMEQAVIDADKLRDAAIRSAENSILEKYSKDIKGALKVILEQAPPMPGMDPEAAMAPAPAPMPAMPPGPDLAAEADIPLAATGGEKLCPCPDVDAKVPITINLDDLIGVADMIKDEDEMAAPEMLEEPPMDPMMRAQPPMDPMMAQEQMPMMESDMIDLSGLLTEQAGDFPEPPDPSGYFAGRGYISPKKSVNPEDIEEVGLSDYAMRALKGAGLGAATGVGLGAAAGAAAGSTAGFGASAALGGAPAVVGAPAGGVIGTLAGGTVAGMPLALAGALGGAATGLLSAAYDDVFNDRDAYQRAVGKYRKDRQDAIYGDKDVTGKPVPPPGGGPAPSLPPTKTAGPEKDPTRPGYTSPSDAGSRDPLKAPGFGSGEGEISVDDYFVDGRYKSALGFTPGTSSFLREKNSVQMEMARQRLEAGDYSALGTVRRLQAELRTIPQYTKVDNAIARQMRKSGKSGQRIMTRKVRQQARPELRSQRRELRNMPRQEFTGVGGGYSAFPQAQLQEGKDNMIDITEEQLSSIIEELVVDMSPDSVRAGWAGLPESEKDYAEELELARRSSTEEKEKQEAIQKTVEDLSEKNDRLTKYSTELSEVAKQLKEKLEDVSLQNAKLFYINRTLSDVSLNGRQKDKIAESIQSAVSVEEAKVIYETLQSAVPNSPSEKRGKKSLSEAISRPSTILPRRKSGASDREMVFRDRMKILAGIK